MKKDPWLSLTWHRKQILTKKLNLKFKVNIFLRKGLICQFKKSNIFLSSIFLSYTKQPIKSILFLTYFSLLTHSHLFLSSQFLL